MQTLFVNYIIVLIDEDNNSMKFYKTTTDAFYVTYRFLNSHLIRILNILRGIFQKYT